MGGKGSSGGSSYYRPPAQSQSGGGGGGGWQESFARMMQAGGPQAVIGRSGGGETDMPQGNPSRANQNKAIAANAAKYAALGATMFGAPGAVAGAGYGAYDERKRQAGEQSSPTNVPRISGQQANKTGPFTNPRANMPGRQLTGGQIPMRPGSNYGRYPVQGPPLRAGSSILGGGDDSSISTEDDEGFGGYGEGL